LSVPVVLLHGFGTSSARTWGENGWFDLLADSGREAIGIDLLGHGTAPKPHDPAAYEELPALAAAQMPPGPVDAIGFSLGARTLLNLAADQPGRFRRIVTLGVGANLMRPADTDGLVEAVLGEGDSTNPVAQYFARLAQHPDSDPKALAALMRARHTPLTPERLAAVDVPVLVVIGDRDFAGPGDPLAEALPQATLLVLPGVDHFATPKDFGAIDAALSFLTHP
jgi:pimeloyl-ACP methyl ester carboxylesterase